MKRSNMTSQENNLKNKVKETKPKAESKAKVVEYTKRPKMEFAKIEGKKEENGKKIKKKFSGVVVSDKMDKTVVVSVSTVKMHPKYHKRFRRDKKYKVHDEENKYKTGDTVTFVPCRPISRDKRWKVV